MSLAEKRENLILHYPLNGMPNNNGKFNFNLLKNGKFLNGLNNWTVSANTIELVSTGGLDNNPCLRVNQTVQGTITPRQGINIILLANLKYSVSCKIKVESGSFEGYNARIANVLSFSEVTHYLIKNNWYLYFFESTPTTDIATNNNAFGFYNPSNSNACVFLITDIKLEMGEPSIWAPTIEEFGTLPYNKEYDISGLSLNLDITGSGITFSNDTPRYNMAAHWDETTSYLKKYNFIPPNIFTISFWFKFNSNGGGGYHIPIALGDNTSGNLIYYIDKSAGIRFYCTLGSNRYNYTLSPNNNGDNIWHHYAVTYNGSTIQGYYDGSPVNSIPASGNLPLDTANTILIGIGYGNLRWSINCAESDVRIYNVTLTANEIKELYDMGKVN